MQLLRTCHKEFTDPHFLVVGTVAISLKKKKTMNNVELTCVCLHNNLGPINQK